MKTSTYYNLNLVEGNDIVNPLTTDVPNYETIDEQMHNNAITGITLASEVANGTTHALIRENSECAVIRFIATSEWKAGDTVTVDGVPVTALLPSGETLPNGAYVINANVLCILTGTNLTVYAEREKTINANEIAYNETTVGAELTTLNSNLNDRTTATPTSSHTINNLSYIVKKVGIVTATISITTTAEVTQFTNIANIPLGYRPIGYVYEKTSNGDVTVAILNNGNVQVMNSIASGTTISFSTTYVCAD